LSLSFNYHQRKWVILFVILSALLCMGLSAWLGIQSVRHLTQVSENLFNQRQLAQAQKIASDIQERFLDLELALLDMAEIVGRRGNKGPEEKALAVLFNQLRHHGVSEFQTLDDRGNVLVGFGLVETPVNRVEEIMDWAHRQKKTGLLLITPPFLLPQQTDPHRYVLVAVPTLRSSGEFVGACFLRVAADLLAQRAVAGVVSGISGYAWVIDPAGTFLAHLNSDFVGRDSLQVRRETNPRLSYRGIERLTKDLLLKGAEGTGDYESGWHRQKVGRIKKLIAYTPVRFIDRPGFPSAEFSYSPVFWSVAMVAPAEEVSGIIREAYRQQWIITGLLLGIILLAAISIIYVAGRWSSMLQSEIEKVKMALQDSQRKLLDAERLASIGKAAAIMSHEIKNPLIVIGGFARQLAQKLVLDERSHQKLVLITEEVDRLEKMLGEVKDITRRVPPQFQVGQINGIIRSVREMLKEELEKQNIRLGLELSKEGEAGPCLFDPNQIKQVLLNFIKNAAEAMPEGGIITIRAGREKEYDIVEIEDTGKGIQPDDLKEIFNPFFTTKQKGTGLGLAISLKIIEDHGGDIRVSSEVGQGTIFKMRLPCSPPDRGAYK
jgi:two-component system sensor histidine kinase HydH